MAIFRIITFTRLEVTQETAFAVLKLVGRPRNLFSFLPVRAAYSHSPSDGRRNALPIVPVASSRILCINSYAIRRRQSLVPKKHRLRDNHRNPDERNTYGIWLVVRILEIVHPAILVWVDIDDTGIQEIPFAA